MIEKNSMVILAHGAPSGFVLLAVFLWLASCLAGVIGLLLSFFRGWRKLAIAMAYIAVCFIALIVFLILISQDGTWNPVDDWAGTWMLVLILGMPCALGMALIMYHRQKVRPRK